MRYSLPLFCMVVLLAMTGVAADEQSGAHGAGERLQSPEQRRQAALGWLERASRAGHDLPWGDHWWVDKWVAVGLAQANEMDRALAVAQGIPDAKLKDEALEQIAEAAVWSRDDFMQGMRAAELIEAPELRSDVFTSIAMNLGRTRRIAELRGILPKITRPADQDFARHALIASLARSGQVATALKEVEGTPPLNLIEIRLIVAQLAESGKIAQAMRLAETISTDFEEDRAKALCAVMLRADEIDQGLQLLQRSVSGNRYYFIGVADHLERANHAAAARRAISMIKDPEIRVSAWVEISNWRAWRGDVPGALAAMGEIDEGASQPGDSSHHGRSFCLMKIATAQARAGEWAAALESFKGISPVVWFYYDTLGRTVAGAVENGQTEEAERVVDEVKPLEKRIEVELGIAEGLLRSWACGDPSPHRFPDFLY